MMKTMLGFVCSSRINKLSCTTSCYFLKYYFSQGRSISYPFFCSNNAFGSLSGDDKSGNTKESDLDVTNAVMKSGKYELFKDDHAPFILDVIEERQKIQDAEEGEEVYEELSGLNLERGVTGVFDIEDLVSILQKENAKNIAVVAIPQHLRYVDYIVVVTGKSVKHMLGLAHFVRRLYKIKRHKTDTIPRLEGESSKDWLALDLGNIALHIMSKSARPIYDIEGLWAVGKEFDKKSQESIDPLVEILKKHAIKLDDFQPDHTRG